MTPPSRPSAEILANNGALLRARLPIATKKPDKLASGNHLE
ncbi:MAG: hypothetical protein QMD04_11905 [Anaerolineales bacterium]|nr:hypothetical protein [Anaerolineales bacterium]